MRYAVVTFGCRVNQADSLGFEEELTAAGATRAEPADADLVVVNTCSVTATADQGARQTIRRIARDNPAAKIVVTGCYATRSPAEVGGLPNVLRVVPNDHKPKLIALTLELSTAERYGDGDGACGATIAPGHAGRTAFTLRVQTGCSEPCSYCIIPTTRGAPRSVPVDHVLREVERIARAGFKEIALTGVHLGSYGRDLSPRTSLYELLSALDRWNATAAVDRGATLFRISSLEPMDCTREIVDLVTRSSSFAAHFHLPLQHASDRILRRMRRPYSIAEYAALVDVIRAKLPDAAIGSDVIVGFPGEQDGDFEQLERYLNGSPLTHLHVFPYSDRPGTAAASMSGAVAGAVVRQRAGRLREISRRLATSFRAGQTGRIHRALTIDDGATVVTGNYLKARIPEGWPRNMWVDVRVGADGELAEVLGACYPSNASAASC